MQMHEHVRRTKNAWNKYLYGMMNDKGSGRRWNGYKPRTFLANPFVKFEDLGSFRKIRFIIGFKESTMGFNPKVLSSIFHETRRFQMFEWLRFIIGLYKKREKKIKIKKPCTIRIVLKSTSSTFHEIQGFRMDVWMVGLIIGPYIWNKEKRCMRNLCDPKVHSIILSRNPKIWDGCLNDRTYHWVLWIHYKQ